jgi:membrane protein
MEYTCKRKYGYAFEVLRKSYTQFDRDRILEVSAGATFFILLALFPAFASIVTLYGLIADRATIVHELYLISRFLPRGALLVLDAELQRLIAQKVPKLGLTFVVSTALALWSASGGLKAVTYGLNVAYEVQETRGFWRRSALALMFTAAAILLCLLAMILAAFLPAIAGLFPFHSLFRPLVPVLGWPIAFGFGLLVLAAIYSYGPDRRRPWQWITWGSALASSLWLVGTLIFKWYVHNFGNFDRVYGNLGAIVGFLTWIWLSLVIILFGAELNRELERRNRTPSEIERQRMTRSSAF